MNFFLWVAFGLLTLLCLYIAARIISAAIFRSKMDYDERRQNGTKQNLRT